MQTLTPTPRTTARSVQQAMWRGAAERCPACGVGHLFRAYLKVVDRCPNCGEELHHHRADDAPPYFTILIVGHVVIAGVLWLEEVFAPAAWVQAAVWIPLTFLLTLALLPRIKGALVGLQWALRMHGFGGVAEGPQEPLPSLPRLSAGVTITRGGKG
ncbi:MAG TPA: DUF983 domain-containing protein [Hyphomicrobiaceae bacterium]|nr:DUF983 domain-containing protein [Hyphomicrobiaceae bacterium]